MNDRIEFVTVQIVDYLLESDIHFGDLGAVEEQDAGLILWADHDVVTKRGGEADSD